MLADAMAAAGAVSIVVGVSVLLGFGAAFVVAGVLLILGAWRLA